MITAAGYSKDPSIIPEGIVVTMGAEMISEQGGLLTFLRALHDSLSGYEEGRYWMHKCKNRPQFDVLHIYIIVNNRLYGRVPFAGHFSEPQQGYTADGRKVIVNWNYFILSGPFERCPFKRTLKGFQGFRYCERLW